MRLPEPGGRAVCDKVVLGPLSVPGSILQALTGANWGSSLWRMPNCPASIGKAENAVDGLPSKAAFRVWWLP